MVDGFLTRVYWTDPDFEFTAPAISCGPVQRRCCSCPMTCMWQRFCGKTIVEHDSFSGYDLEFCFHEHLYLIR